MVGLKRLMPGLTRALGALLSPAEDPRQAFASSHLRQQQLLAQVRTALAAAADARARLQSGSEKLSASVQQLEDQAKAALSIGHESAARRLLLMNRGTATELAVAEAQVAAIAEDEASLVTAERALVAQIEAYTTSRELAAARYRAAETEVRVGEAMTRVSAELAILGIALNRAQERANHMQAVASAYSSLVNGRAPRDRRDGGGGRGASEANDP